MNATEIQAATTDYLNTIALILRNNPAADCAELLHLVDEELLYRLEADCY